MPVLPSIWSSATPPQPLAANQVHVWAWSLDPAGSTHAHLSLLDVREQERFHRFHFEHDRVRFALSHAHTRRILASYLERPPASLLFETNPFGKPQLAPEPQTAPLRFNLSHTHSLALLAVSSATELGIDVEDIRPIEPEVAQHHFSPNECAALASLEGTAWLRSFFLCWTRKEAIVKAEGIGLSLPLASFDVSLLPDAPPRLLAVRPPAAFRHSWTLHDLTLPPGIVAALATGTPQTDIRCFQLQNESA